MGDFLQSISEDFNNGVIIYCHYEVLVVAPNFIKLLFDEILQSPLYILLRNISISDPHMLYTTDQSKLTTI